MGLHHYPPSAFHAPPSLPSLSHELQRRHFANRSAKSAEGPAGSMDEMNSSLAELLMQDLRVENGCIRVLHMGADQAIAVAPTRRPSLYAVLRGSTTIRLADGSHTRVEAGEIAIVFYGDGHRIGEGRLPERLPTPPTAQRTPDRLQHCRFDGDKPGTVVLQAICDLGYFGKSALSHRAAPDLFAMLKDGRHEEAYTMQVFPYCEQALLDNIDGPGGQAMVFAFANLQVCHAIRHYATSTWGGSFRNIRNPNLRRICTVLREIRAHPERDWSVETMAAHVGLSRSAFALAFQEIVGKAPMSLLKKERMERAAKLLLKDSLSMHEVGNRVGYHIESSFARAFKRHWGVPPRAFAKSYSNTEAGDAAAS